MARSHFFTLALCSALFASAAVAQDGHSSHSEPATPLPEVCNAGVEHEMAPMPAGEMEGADQAHRDLMAGMDEMNADMMRGGMAPDIDVAFVCSMIPHHQGAIDMARAELEHGDDPWAKEAAQKVIDAQQQEIAEMLEWLGQQAP